MFVYVLSGIFVLIRLYIGTMCWCSTSSCHLFGYFANSCFGICSVAFGISARVRMCQRLTPGCLYPSPVAGRFHSSLQASLTCVLWWGSLTFSFVVFLCLCSCNTWWWPWVVGGSKWCICYYGLDRVLAPVIVCPICSPLFEFPRLPHHIISSPPPPSHILSYSLRPFLFYLHFSHFFCSFLIAYASPITFFLQAVPRCVDWIVNQAR